MSGTHDGAPVIDPLDALRAADHRPAHEVWRERIGLWLQNGAAKNARTGALSLGLLAVAIAIGWRLFVASEPPIEDSLPLAQPAATTAPIAADTSPGVIAGSVAEPAAPPEVLVVHVAGSVMRPGLVTGRVGWRVDDAVNAAGGAVGAADLDRLNLAAPIADGQRIFVPVVGENEPSVLTPDSGITPGESAGGPVNLNTADGPTLESLPGVGPATAATIISHREEHGPFGDVDALVAVRGIGPATLDALRDHVTVG